MTIKTTIFSFIRQLLLCAASVLFCLSVMADTVWHCSRTDVQVANASDNFTLAALDTEREVMRISLKDLYAIYQGKTVKVSGIQVSACFIGTNDAVTQNAMRSIGADTRVLERLSSQGSLVQSHIYQVLNEKDMLACMTKHQPAIGYFSKTTQHEAVGPCF